MAVEFPGIVDNLVQCRDAEIPALFSLVMNCIICENSSALSNVIEYGPTYLNCMQKKRAMCLAKTLFCDMHSLCESAMAVFPLVP